MQMTECLARPDRSEPSTLRCTACRLVWDKTDDDAPLCPRTQIAQRDAHERLPYASGLAPDPFGR